MSKWRDDFEKNFKTVKNVRKVTREKLLKEKKLAFEEYHDPERLAKLKQILKQKI